MNVCINILERKRVTVESLGRFLQWLVDHHYIAPDGIRRVSNVYYHAETGTERGESHEVQHIDEALSSLSKLGAEPISISLNYRNHYEMEGRPGDGELLSKIMYCLNIAAAQASDNIGEDLLADFYLGVYFKSGTCRTEWGNIEVCRLQLGGEGAFLDDTDMDSALLAITEAMRDECPEFEQLRLAMTECFGPVRLTLEPSVM